DGTQLQAACDKDEHGSLEAVLYEDLHVDMKKGSGQEMPDLINIACDQGAVAKAGLWGYKPYDLGVEDFIAGVRMIRADYCGDGGAAARAGAWAQGPCGLGVEYGRAGGRMARAAYCGDGGSWTRPATALGIRHGWGLTEVSGPDPKTEAFWTENGAACVYAPR